MGAFDTAVLAAGPVAYYKMGDDGDSADGVLRDASGNARHGTYYGAVSWVDTADGGKGARFLAPDQYAEVPYAAWMDPAAFTILVVHTPEAYANYTNQTLIAGWDQDWTPNIPANMRPFKRHHSITTGGTANFWATNESGMASAYNYGSPALTHPLNETRMYTTTFDGTNWTTVDRAGASPNGNYTFWADPENPDPMPNTAALRIGQSAMGDHRFRGVVSAVAVFDRALTLSEIATIYNAGLPTPTALPVAGELLLTGGGTLALAGPLKLTVDVALGGAGSAAVDLTIKITPSMHLTILDDALYRAPTVAVVSLVGAIPNAAVDFFIDGNYVDTRVTDSDGNLFAISISVDDTHLAGTHTLTTYQAGAANGSVTFTLDQDPMAAESAVGADTAPVAIPGTLQPSGYYKWVLQDLMPGGLGSYILPWNPQSWISPAFERVLTAHHTTAQDGQFHIIEGQEPVAEWSFTGLCPTQEMHDKLVAFGKLNRRFYLIDHWNRAWKVTFLNVDMRARRRTNIDGTVTDWAHDYTVTAAAYSQTPAVPQ